ncbi:cell wall-binding protein [Clostridium botulinum]|nr:cell wall-binding protein [Clostridium botulinum]MBY6804213.1 cell wall-binding protein [Clostridium botulinum]MBY6813176.1 cell wall-binding protein [Clostridium botulinum]MBY6821647.1 cell wall-binding protein [Clostridium botulinum]NFJ49795.1 cell wall-binding protein [Clostridium botulinum]
MKRIRLKKVMASALIVTSILALKPIGASAEWKNDNTGWWYSEGNSYSIGWKSIDGIWYYFYPNGYMAKDTTVDGCILKSNGAYDAETQSKKISVVYPSNWLKVVENGIELNYLDDKGTNLTSIAVNMGGLSKENFIKLEKLSLGHDLGISKLETAEQVFNNKKADIIHYFRKDKNNRYITIFHVVFYKGNVAYVFTISELEKVSDQNMADLKNMLNTVEFVD